MLNTSNLYLSPTAQSQLQTLKAANSYPVNRLLVKRAELTAKEAPLESIQVNTQELKAAVSKLKSPELTDAQKVDALASLVKEFNDVHKLIGAQMEKGAPLRGVQELRGAKIDLRRPLAEGGVLTELKAAGVTTTRDGLSVTTTTPATLSEALLNKLMAAVDQVESKVTSAQDRTAQQSSRVSEQIESAQRRVDAANKRTESSFIAYYSAMQAYQSANTSTFSWMA